MRRTAWMVLAVLALSTGAFAHNSIEFGNSAGGLTGSMASLRLSGSMLADARAIVGLGKGLSHLGSPSFATADTVERRVSFRIPTGSLKSGFYTTTALAYIRVDCKKPPVVPEPGTLGLLGTGLVGLAAVLRRKARA